MSVQYRQREILKALGGTLAAAGPNFMAVSIRTGVLASHTRHIELRIIWEAAGNAESPVRRSYLLGEHSQEVEQVLGSEIASNGPLAVWPVKVGADLHELTDYLDRGGWALLFFRRDTTSGSLPSALSTKPVDLETLLRSSCADAILVSWYDNTEWIFAVLDEGP